jgi:hypothetical protein
MTPSDIHDRFTRGQPISEEEHDILQRWYDDNDRQESILLSGAADTDSPEQSRPPLLDVLARLDAVSRQLHEVASANERLRAENLVLQQQLTQSVSESST